MIWRKKLADMLVGRASLNPDELADHHGCRLGKWYDQQTNPALTSLPEWRQLEEPHRKVHAHGIQAATHYRNGAFNDAVEEVRLAGEASVDVLRLLDAIAAQNE